MKRMDKLCASQASTAICLSMVDQASCSSSINTTTLHGGSGGRAIDRHNPIINDSSRRAPCSSSSQPLPINPKPYHKAKKNDKKKSISENSNVVTTNNYFNSSKPIDGILRRSLVKAPSTPAGSTGCLLSDGLSDFDHVSPPLTKVVDETKNNASSKCSGSSDQVVVLRVSLHCKGCEGKVRKHLSRMQGVTSFNIDFAAKKVTVVGDVTPLSVLASISKVKNAQFWPEPSSAGGSGTIETKKNNTVNTQISPLKI